MRTDNRITRKQQIFTVQNGQFCNRLVACTICRFIQAILLGLLIMIYNKSNGI